MTASPVSNGFGQVIVGTKDLGVTSARWQKMGFQVLPRMHYPAFGSSAQIIQLARCYINLLGDTDRMPRPFRDYYSERLKYGEGIAGLSFNSASLEQDRSALIDLGLEPSECSTVGRQIAMPDGIVRDTQSRFFSLSHPLQPFLGLSWLQHLTPETMYVRQYQTHTNGAIDVQGLTIATQNPAADAAFFAQVSGGQISGSREQLRITTVTGQWIEFLHPFSRGVRLPRSEREVLPKCCGLIVGLTLSVRSLAQCRRALDDSLHSECYQDEILVPSAFTGGPFVRFTET